MFQIKETPGNRQGGGTAEGKGEQIGAWGRGRATEQPQSSTVQAGRGVGQLEAPPMGGQDKSDIRHRSDQFPGRGGQVDSDRTGLELVRLYSRENDTPHVTIDIPCSFFCTYNRMDVDGMSPTKEWKGACRLDALSI